MMKWVRDKKYCEKGYRRKCGDHICMYEQNMNVIVSKIVRMMRIKIMIIVGKWNEDINI